MSAEAVEPLDVDQELPGMPAAPEVVVKAVPDPAAPYGRRADGTPKGRPGRPPKARANAAGPKVPPAPRKSAPSAPRSKANDYGTIVAGPLQAVGLTLAVVGQQTGNAVALADSCAIADATPALAAAIGDLADQTPAIAALLDRLAAVGPYSALVAALTPLALQLAANHGFEPAVKFGAGFGVVAPEDLLRRNGFNVSTAAPSYEASGDGSTDPAAFVQ